MTNPSFKEEEGPSARGPSWAVVVRSLAGDRHPARSDRDALGLDLLGDRDGQLKNAVLMVGFNVIVVEASRQADVQGELAIEDAAAQRADLSTSHPNGAHC